MGNEPDYTQFLKKSRQEKKKKKQVGPEKRLRLR